MAAMIELALDGIMNLTNDELLRYSRQILLDTWDMEAQLSIKNANILIVGMGGLGCPVATILSRAGVGALHLVDFDVIDESNLQRQTLFYPSDIGKPKAKIASERLQMHNAYIKISHSLSKLDEHTIQELNIAQFHLVIDCSDNFAIRQLLNKTCQTHHIPLLSNSAIGESGQIALFTQETGCYYCLFGHTQDNNHTCANSGVLASTVHVIGSITAQIALDFLGRQHNPIKDTLLLWQGTTMGLQKIKFFKKSDCPICQTSNNLKA